MGRDVLYELPEMYKALAIAYERAKGDEGWKIVHERMSQLVSYLEGLNSLGSSLGLDVASHLKEVSARALSLVEGGNAAGALELFERSTEYLRNVEDLLRASRSYMIALRLSSSFVVLASSALLLLWALGKVLIVSATLYAVSAGAALGSLLIASSPYSHWALALAAALQIFSLAFSLGQMGYTEVLLVAVSALVAIGLISAELSLKRRLSEAITAASKRAREGTAQVGEVFEP
ncbi:MAG: hypothetical protein N3F67_03240 [Acidilobaceae archaeon]|nr:hypothetical protein [Acidilobaceae archaeon]